MAHPLRNVLLSDKMMKVSHNISVCSMSTFILELENRCGICYSIKSAMKPDEKAVFFFVIFAARKKQKKMAFSSAAVNLVRFASRWNDGKMEYWNIGFFMRCAEYRIGHYASTFFLE
jgi:hypothetical protein